MIKEAFEETSDPNILAYKKAHERGDFRDLNLDTYVFFYDGKFEVSCSASEVEREKKKLDARGKSDFFYTQPNKPRKPHRSLNPSQKRR